MSRARPAKPDKKIHWPSALQLGGSGLALPVFLSAAAGSLAYAIFSFANSSPAEAVNLLLVTAASLAAGLLVLPSAAYSLARLLGRSLPSPRLSPQAARLLPLTLPGGLAAAIAVGTLFLQNELGVLLSPFHVLAAVLTVAWLAWLGLRGLQLGSAQLRWGGLASGMSAAPLIAVPLEAAGSILVFLIGVIYVVVTPSLSGQIQHIQNILPLIEDDPTRLLDLMQDFVQDPIILSLVLTNFSLFTPLIEELAKPVAVWLLVWRRPLTNAQGFGLGLLGGAGFGLLENLFSGAQTLDWTGTAIVRIGATAFHMATAGLMGWAIVRAKNEARYLAVFVVYGFNILLHGLWNGVVVYQSFAQTAGPADLAPLGGAILLIITIISVAILYKMNRRLQPLPAPQAPAKHKRTVASKTKRK